MTLPLTGQVRWPAGQSLAAQLSLRAGSGHQAASHGHPAHLDDPAAAADIASSAWEREEIDAILANAVEIVGPAPEAMP